MGLILLEDRQPVYLFTACDEKPTSSPLTFSFRVGIWPPSQRAPAPAVVSADRPTRHEPEEWGRGGTPPFGSVGFRWATNWAAENHDLWSGSQISTWDRRCNKTNIRRTSPFHQFLRLFKIYIWQCRYLRFNKSSPIRLPLVHRFGVSPDCPMQDRGRDKTTCF